jgi:hypothetical protein
MSSKRGRKRNDNLPPNRARDVQRAFRARRAAHLDVSLFVFSPTFTFIYSLLSLSQALGQRVAELEEENSNLRAALNLPPANRPLLGKRPTGKDKPKRLPARPPRLATNIEAGSGGGSSADSPTSSRAQSLSPSTITATMRPSPNAIHSLEGSSWDQGMLMGEEINQHSPYSSSPSTGYRFPGLPAHTKAPSQYIYPSPAQPSARPTLPRTMHMPASQDFDHFDHPTDRPRPEAYRSGNYPVRDLKANQQRFPHLQPYSVPEAVRLPQHLPSTQDLHYSTQTQQHRDAPSARKRTISDPLSLVSSMERLAC